MLKYIGTQGINTQELVTHQCTGLASNYMVSDPSSEQSSLQGNSASASLALAETPTASMGPD